MSTIINIEDIVRHWGLAGITITPIRNARVFAWDIGGKYVLKKHSNADELKRSCQLARLLAAEGIPVAAYIPTSDGQMTNPDGLYCLMSKLPGGHADLYEHPSLAFGLGRELARLHVALKNIEPQVTLCHDNDLTSEWRKYIKPGLDGAVSGKRIARAEAWLYELYPKLPRQLIHRDVHLNNMLFHEGQVTGWFDFYISRKDVRLFDLVYLLSSLQTNNLERADKWRSLCNDIIAGYDIVQPLTSYEHDALPVLMIVNTLLFVAFWGCENVPDKQKMALECAEWLFGECKI